MKALAEKLLSIKIAIGIILIIIAKLDLYFAAKATEAGSNNFIIWVLGFMFVARVADKVVEKINVK